MMKRNIAAKFMALILCTVILLNAAALYGCKKEGEIVPEVAQHITEGIAPEDAQRVTEEIAPKVAQRVTNVYRSDFLSLPEYYSPSGKLSYFDGRLYMLCSEVVNKTNFMPRTVLYSVDTKGENPQSVPIELGVKNTYINININNLLQSSDGSLVIVASSYNQTTQAQSFQLIKKAPDGSTVFTVDPEPLFPDSGTGANNPYGGFYINYAALDGESNIYLGNLMQDSSALVCLSPDGKKLFDIPITGLLSDIAVGADGRVFVKYYYNGSAGSETEIRYIDVQKKALGEKLGIPDTGVNLLNSKIYLGDGYDLYIKNDTGLYGVNQSETEPVLLANWLNSDVNPDSFQSMVVINPDQCVYMGYDQLTNKQQIAFLTRVPDDEVTPKFLINIACLNSYFNLNSHIVAFNRQSNDYRVVLKDYSTYNTSQDNEAGANILKNEIAAGNIPDIMLFHYYQLPVESYETKGIFVDLYEYLDKDPELSRNDFMECAMKPFERDGKLYQMVTSFSVETLIGKTANIGSAPSWTSDEILTFAKNLPQGVSLLKNMTKLSMLHTLMTANTNEFIDYEAGTCSFEKDTFIELLKNLNTLPNEIDNSQRDPGQDQFEIYRENKVMLASIDFNSFAEYLRINLMFGDEDVNFIGYPTTKNIGARMTAGSGYSISSKSPVKDGAWKFIKYCVLALNEAKPNYQGFPPTKTAFENFAKQEMSTIYNFLSDGRFYNSGHFDPDAEDAEKIIADYEARGQQVRLLTQEDVDAVKKYVDSLSQSSIIKYDWKIREILNEEVKPFFEGAKSAEETAKIIQNRVSIYLSEQQ
jgi:ABC-type glycerol-3-phosphate transport system substrate-binding protein